MKRRVKNLEDEWQRLAEDLILDAEQVDCPMDAFLDGLKDIATAIMDRRSMG